MIRYFMLDFKIDSNSFYLICKKIINSFFVLPKLVATMLFLVHIMATARLAYVDSLLIPLDSKNQPAEFVGKSVLHIVIISLSLCVCVCASFLRKNFQCKCCFSPP